MSKEKQLKISLVKQYGELFEVDNDFIEDVEYMKWAVEIVQQLKDGYVDVELIAKVRLRACNDRKHLKGDYCIELAKKLHQIYELEKDLQGKILRNNEGKKLKATETLIKSIYRNHINKDMSVQSFCSIAGISKNKYYRIINRQVEDPATKRYLKTLYKQVKNE